MKRTFLAAYLCVAGCTLEHFEKLTEFCGMPPTSTPECLACVAASNCCEKTTACAADTSCSGDLGRAVTPSSVFSDAYAPVLTCIQQACDAPCGISWGCLDGYRIDLPDKGLESSLILVDSSGENGTEGLEARACRGTDPTCLDGTLLGTSNADGRIAVSSSATFADFFRVSQPGYSPADPTGFVPSNTRWSEPVFFFGPVTTYVFQQRQVRSLVQVSLGADVFEPAQSHLVFFAHNCLPTQYAFQGSIAPYAQGKGVTFRIEPNPEKYSIVYTGDDALPDLSLTKTSTVGSAGVAVVPSNFNLTVIASRNGSEIARSVINAPEGGLGIVHLVPAALPDR